MATVTAFTAERMLDIENSTIVDGDIVGDNLILKRRDDVTIDAGNVRGPIGLPGITEGQMADEMAAAFLLNAPICSIIETLETVAPNAFWLTMVGQTVVDGETLYPLFWSKIPAAMKSGSNIIMPNTKGRVSVGLDPSDANFDSIGETGGAKTHVLTEAQMPAHDHAGTTGDDKTDHQHGFGGTTSEAGTHNHTPGTDLFMIEDAGGSGINSESPVSFRFRTQEPTSLDGAHDHDFSGVTGGINANHQHDFATDSAGGGTAHNNLQPYITFLKIIKVA